MEVKNRISVLFSRYVAGDANKAEVAELLELIKNEDADLELGPEMEHFWNQQNAAVKHDVDWQRIYDRALAAQPDITSVPQNNRRVWLSALPET